jgi:cytochrome b561
MKKVSRYHPLLVFLHWLLAALIIGALIFGYFVLAPMANANPEKIGLLRLHMAGGILIFGLMAIRFLVRMASSRPAEATTGYRAVDRLAPIAHYGFYILVLAMVASGVATSIVSRINLIVFGNSGDALPPTLTIYPPRIAHGYFAAALAALIALHVIAALYHQFVRKDGLFGRMGFGRRAID